MAGELRALGRKIGDSMSDSALRPVAFQAGKVAKEATFDAAERDLGGDRAMSNFRGGSVPLKAGYDIDNPRHITMNLRPAGLWTLADEGRRRQGVIRPKRRGGKKALRTPEGFRALSHYSTSRGLNTIEDARRQIETQVPPVVERALAAALLKNLG